MNTQELYDKVKGKRPALHTIMTFLGYSKPNYDRLKKEIEEMLGISVDEMPEEFISLVCKEYFGDY